MVTVVWESCPEMSQMSKLFNSIMVSMRESPSQDKEAIPHSRYQRYMQLEIN